MERPNDVWSESENEIVFVAEKWSEQIENEKYGLSHHHFCAPQAPSGHRQRGGPVDCDLESN